MHSVKTVTLKAHFDGEKICLNVPFALRPDARLFVRVVADANGEGAEKSYALGPQSRARAYADEELDYSDSLDDKPADE